MAQLSPGGGRPFTFADIIHALQQDTENANQANYTDSAFGALVSANESCVLGEGAITAAASAAVSQWGTMEWGHFVWGA